MRSSIRASIVAIAMISASGCTWVHMAPGAQAVRIIPAGGSPAGCEKRGDIAVSVKGKIGFYERNPLRVREELETLARNEGPGLAADTLQPLDEPHDGEQRFAAYRCGATKPVPGPARPASEGAQTFPIKD